MADGGRSLTFFSFVAIAGFFLYLCYSLCSSYFVRRSQLQHHQQNREEAFARLQSERRQEALQNQELEDAESNGNKSIRLNLIFDSLKFEIIHKGQNSHQKDNCTTDNDDSKGNSHGDEDVIVQESTNESPIQKVGKFLSSQPTDDSAHKDQESKVATHYSSSSRSNDDKFTTNVFSIQEKSQIECCICLEPYESGQVVCSAKTPDCYHVFHEGCALQWLQDHSECPLCRVTLVSESAPTDK